MVIVFIDGVYGSGKTTLVSKIAKRLGQKVVVVSEGYLTMETDNAFGCDAYNREWMQWQCSKATAAAEKHPEAVVLVDSSPIMSCVYHPEIVIGDALEMIRQVGSRFYLVRLDVSATVQLEHVMDRLSTADAETIGKRIDLNELDLNWMCLSRDRMEQFRAHYTFTGDAEAVIAYVESKVQ